MTSRHLVTAAVLAASLCSCGAESDSSDPVNAVLGDLSFVEAYGRAPTVADDNVLRIRTHLAYVEARLRDNPPDGLSDEQLAARSHHLDVLADYIAAGRFPENHTFMSRRPVFIDDEGTVCAVGHLIERSVGLDAAEAIAREHLFDFVADIDDPAVVEWAEQAGFTVEELAMIQPAYGWEPPDPPPPEPPNPWPRPPMFPRPPTPPPVVVPPPVASNPTVMQIAAMFQNSSFSAARQAIRAQGEELSKCWPDNAREHDVLLSFSLQPDGDTEGVRIVSPTRNHDPVAMCVCEVLMGMHFTPFSGSADQITYRFDHMTALTGWPSSR